MTIFKSKDPATEAVNWEGEAAGPAQVQAAVDDARAAFPAWADIAACKGGLIAKAIS